MTSNDEVERRAGALSTNEVALSQSSIDLWFPLGFGFFAGLAIIVVVGNWGCGDVKRRQFIPIIDSLLGSTKSPPRDRSNRLLGGDFLVRKMWRTGPL
jgi:hypothetical protein